MTASLSEPYDRDEELVGPKAKSKHVKDELDSGAVEKPSLIRV